MRMLSGGIVLVAGLGLAAIWFAEPTESTFPSVASPRQIEQQTMRLEFDRAHRDAFASFLATVYSDLEAGTSSLEQAAQRVVDYSRSYYPRYLEDVQPVETGATPQEKVARNLVRHFQTMSELGAHRCPPGVMARLGRELDALVVAQPRSPRPRADSQATPLYTNQ